MQPSRGARSGRARSRPSETRGRRAASWRSSSSATSSSASPAPRSGARRHTASSTCSSATSPTPGLSKSSRALLHRQMAEWLAGRPVADELVEIRAYHLDQSRRARGGARGARAARPRRATRQPRSSRRVAVRSRARRTPSRGGCSSRADELESTLERRYLAARAAWRMSDIPTVSTEMLDVSEAAQAAGDAQDRGPRAHRARPGGALSATPTTTARASSPAARSSVVEPTDDVGRFDALEVLGTVCWWEGDLDEVERLATERLAIAERIGRLDLAERRAARAQRRLQRPPRAGAGARAAGAGDRARGRAAAARRRGVDAPGSGAAGGARGQARRGRGVTRGGTRDLRRERRRTDARADAQLARDRRLERGDLRARGGSCCARRSAS